MNKLEQAARQALEALEDIFGKGKVDVGAITALREALDHSGEADEMVVGWDRVKPEAIASDPLYQQGFVDGVEEGRNQVAEQAEQEPVGWTHAANLVDDGYGHIFSVHSSEPAYDDWVPLYAAPVRTKDLTDADLRICFKSTNTSEPLAEGWPGLERFARAVIAADREKNK